MDYITSDRAFIPSSSRPGAAYLDESANLTGTVNAAAAHTAGVCGLNNTFPFPSGARAGVRVNHPLATAKTHITVTPVDQLGNAFRRFEVRYFAGYFEIFGGTNVDTANERVQWNVVRF